MIEKGITKLLSQKEIRDKKRNGKKDYGTN